MDRAETRPEMDVAEIMNRDVRTCSQQESLNRVARVMRAGDCGAVPVVDQNKRVVGMITDRDVCLVAHDQGLPLTEIPVQAAMSRNVIAASPHDSVADVEQLMRKCRIRRVPITDRGKLIGVVSHGDIARHAHSNNRDEELSAKQVVQTLGVVAPQNRQNTLAPA